MLEWNLEQERRKSQMWKTCQKYNIDDDLGSYNLNAFTYSDQFNLLFCRNQKVSEQRLLSLPL